MDLTQYMAPFFLVIAQMLIARKNPNAFHFWMAGYYTMLWFPHEKLQLFDILINSALLYFTLKGGMLWGFDEEEKARTP